MNKQENVAVMVKRIAEEIETMRPRENMSATQAADYMGISKSYLEEMKRNYQIPFCRVGSRVIFRRSDLDSFLGERVVRNLKDEGGRHGR